MMMATPRTGNVSESDTSLWELASRGNTSAFEDLVRRYQSLVCSVAYSACGDLALSEDVAQETFWTAWRRRASLEQPDRLRAWLCGIARNLAKDARRKWLRPAEVVEAGDALAGLSSAEPGPSEQAVSREEESLIWKAVARIPSAYREPLILFYREDRSVAEVAEALGLSEDAARQRLSRGRAMLREQVAELVEGGLRRSRPGRRFTATVMAGLAPHAAGAKGAWAGAAGAGAKAAAGAVGAGGALGGLLGSFLGLLGGWLGTWIPAQAAPTRRERDAILRAGRRMLLVSVLFVAALFGLIYALAGTPRYLIAWGGWMAAYWTYLAVECVRLARRVNRIRAEPGPDDLPNETPLRAGWAAVASRVGARVYRSEASLLGLPLLDVNLSAPSPPEAGKRPDTAASDDQLRVACGWIAIGDDARGVLLAVGSTARGLVALGGRAIGVVSLGGIALGLVACGGLGLGVLGIGGLGAGVYAFGGGAVGWRAAGGLAVGWDLACGGGALARHAALGGGAIARDYALGGEAHARHANDEEARAALLDDPFTRLAFTVMGQRHALEQLARATAASAPASAPASSSRTFRLDNGLTVRVRPIRGASDVALLVLYRIGGDQDPQGHSGLAHLVEHLYVTAAAGPEPARTAEAFFRRYRAGCNAQTGDRYTVFATVFPARDLEKELAEAAARMGDLRITAADLDRERGRLLDEVANMFGRIPALGAVNVARELVRPTPRGGRKGGLPEQVSAITLDEARAHWERYNKPRNAILVLAGAVDEAAARRAVTAHFSKLLPGEEAPKPGNPGSPQLGALREVAVQSIQPQAEPAACLAYAAPQPGSENYAPFLVLAARFWAASARAGGGETGRPSVYFPLLEDPAVLGVSATARPGEPAPKAIERLEAFVAETVAPQLRADERASARQMFAFFLETAEVPESALALNPYGAALSLARREQLGIDAGAIGRSFDALTERDLRRAAGEIFAPARHAGAFVSPVK
jgi:zinc protease